MTNLHSIATYCGRNFYKISVHNTMFLFKVYKISVNI